MIIKLIESLRKRLSLLKLIAIAVLLLLVVCDGLLVSKEHAHTAMEQIPGFWALFGLAAALLLILLSKSLGGMGIMKDEDYYDK